MSKSPTQKKRPIHDRDRIIIRLPDGLHEKLQKAADETGQNMTQVAVSLMQWGLARYEPGKDKNLMIDINADSTLSALNLIIENAREARSAFQAILLGKKKV